MKTTHHLINVSLVFLLTFVFASSAQQQVYVVHLEDDNGLRSAQELEALHHSYLHSVKGSLEEAKSSIIYSYTKVINGFAAILKPEEADAISEMDGVISVSEDEYEHVHTARSWNFTSLLESNWDCTKADGLEGLMKKAKYGKDIIVGVIDTGIWPESESFNDEDMDVAPTSWKGICQTGDESDGFKCNRKLIGARYFTKGYEAKFGVIKQEPKSPRDHVGHGTHVASILAGRRVKVTKGYGKGNIRGGAHLARIAVYKVCWGASLTCAGSDMLSAFDNATSDGVDVINVSIGPNMAIRLRKDQKARGALGAVKHNVVVAFAGGNAGPIRGNVSNIAPWGITVGASSTDREFLSYAELGNHQEAEGRSIQKSNAKGPVPLVYAKDIEYAGSTTRETAGQCLWETLSSEHAEGKAVFCLRGSIEEDATEKVEEVQRAKGIAAVIQNKYDGYGVSLQTFPIPATIVLAHENTTILEYINSEQKSPTVTLTPPKRTLFHGPAPFVAAFSSRGPVSVKPRILKPDVIAPGLSIRAAGLNGVYKFDSGTSMACPHVAAVASLLKAIHPTWGEAAIRSAIMTTGKVTNNKGDTITDELYNAATPFEYGSGHIQPSKADDPGLVYNSTYDDYHRFFRCSISSSKTKSKFMCPSKEDPPSHLNYPSLTISDLDISQPIPRRVTNVGKPKSIYNVAIHHPQGYTVKIDPETLEFDETYQDKSFTVTVTTQNDVAKDPYVFGSYTWSDGDHEVRSPIVVHTHRNIITHSTDDKHAANA